MFKIIILTIAILLSSQLMFASGKDPIKEARKTANNAYNVAKKEFGKDRDCKELFDALQVMNSKFQAMQKNAGIRPGMKNDARSKIIRKLKSDKAYKTLEHERNEQNEKIKQLLMSKDPAYKAAEEEFQKIMIKLRGKPKKRMPKTQTKCKTYPSRAIFAKYLPKIDKATTLWFQFPATTWLEAFPIGNGSFGAMIFGGLTKDVVQFNHDSLWTPPDISEDIIKGNYPDKTKEINEMRKLIFENKGYEAHKIANEKIQKRYDVGSYQPFAELNFDYDFGKKLKKDDIKDYHRQLDMTTGVTSTHFKIGETTYERQIFVSDDKSVIGIRLKATGPGKFSANINLSRPIHFEHQKAKTESCGPNSISIAGKAYGDETSPYATSYEAVAKAMTKGGTVSSNDGVLTIKDSSEMTIMLAGATNYNIKEPFKPLPLDLRKDCLKLLESFVAKGWDKEKTKAVAEHGNIFNRVDIRIGKEQKNDIPLDTRVRKSRELAEGEYDHYLTSQLFQMGRYLLISSSRPGSLWVNLRGIWNSELHPSWNSDYHHDINIEMSYWAAEVTNMSECHIPLFDSLKILAPRGRQVASKMFGCRGAFVALCHGVYLTAYPPMPPRSLWAMGGPWDATHIMEHYRFGGDKEYLKNEGYPIMKDYVLFCLDWLVKDPRTGKLVAGPDYSPETAYAKDEEHKKKRQWGHEDMGCAMDQQIIWQLFTDFLEASKVLGVSDDLTKEVKEKFTQLGPTRIGADGTIMEWSQDWISSEPAHRHISHMWAMFPGNQFHVDNAPKMMEAGRKTLAIRTDSDRGGRRVTWSNCYYICFYARFGMAEKALYWINNLNRIRGFNMNLMGSQGQVLDCNYGYPAAVTEMLLQSHTGEIKLLPALPKAWSEGEVSGIVARGGFEISIKWKNGKLIDASILSKLGNPCVVRYKDKKISLNLKKGEKQNLNKALKL